MARHPRARAAPRRRAGVAALVVLGALVALSRVPLTSAAFTATTANGPNAFAAAPSFSTCDSPGSTTVTVQNDAMLVESDPTGNYGSSVPISVRASAGDNRRVLTRPPLPNIPADCELLSATIRFVVVAGSPGRTYDIYRASGNWNVNTVTWNTQPAAVGTPGSATLGSGATFDVDITAPMLAIIAAGASNNDGVVVRDRTESTASTFTTSFDSIDGSQPARVTYTWG